MIREHNLILKNLNEKVKQQQAERDIQFHEAYGEVVRKGHEMIRELLDEKTQDIASKFGLNLDDIKKRRAEIRTQTASS
jgi:hypothetical protein